MKTKQLFYKNISVYKPLPRFVTVSKSKIHGLGIFSKTSIPAYYILGLTHIEDDRFEDKLIRTPLGGFLNHSQNPNCILLFEEEFYWLQTLSGVEEDTELTVNYNKYDVNYLKESNA